MLHVPCFIFCPDVQSLQMLIHAHNYISLYIKGEKTHFIFLDVSQAGNRDFDCTSFNNSALFKNTTSPEQLLFVLKNELNSF